MRFQRLLIPVLFLALLFLAYAASAEGATPQSPSDTVSHLVVVEQFELPVAYVVDEATLCLKP